MAGTFMAMVWAVAGGVLLLGTLLLLGSNIMFAMMAAGLSVACLLVAGVVVWTLLAALPASDSLAAGLLGAATTGVAARDRAAAAAMGLVKRIVHLISSRW